MNEQESRTPWSEVATTLERIIEQEIPSYLRFGFGAGEIEQKDDGTIDEPVVFASLATLYEQNTAVAGHFLRLLDKLRDRLKELGADPLAPAKERAKELGADELFLREEDEGDA